MKKDEFLKLVAENAGMKKTDADKVLRSIIGVIKWELRQEGVTKSRLHGLGTFKRVTRPARTAYVPVTREEIQVPERKAVKFIPVKGFMD